MSITVGIDEVGRGCWAGPLVASAVILHRPIIGLKDSKLLNRPDRERLSEVVYRQGTVSIGFIMPSEIDNLGLTKATNIVMAAALAKIKEPYDEIIIDGHINYLPANPKARHLIKADITVAAVSAASIVAKVWRDSYMRNMAVEFPLYGFDHNVGYGTKLHREMIMLYGPCKMHRMSYRPLKAVK